MIAGIKALLLAALLMTGGEDKPILVFSGNLVLNEEVYRALLDFPADAEATTANARLVRSRLSDFLRRSGYELSKVRTQVKDGQILVKIDEGRVDKVIVLGQGAFTTLRVKLDLSLPHDVFNRPLLDRQLKWIAEKYDLRNYRYELVRVGRAVHFGPQIEDLGLIQNAPLIPPAAPLELRILLEGFEWQTGFSPELALNSFEGLGIGARFREASTFMEHDRLELRALGSGTFRERIYSSGTRPVLSHALFEMRYFTPPIASLDVRPFFRLGADFLNRQREDLGLEDFLYLSLDASIAVQVRLIEALSVSFGVGGEHRRLFGLDRAPDYNPLVDQTPRSQTLPFLVSAFDLILNPNEMRRDRKHSLSVEARAYARANTNLSSLLRIQGRYQKAFLLGWHELWLRASGVSLFGAVPFPDEQAVGGSYLRGPFVNSFYAKRVASSGVELRVSLIRDLLKLGIFHDIAVFRLAHAEPPTHRVRWANAFGLGLHVLMLDAFQLDAYYGIGFAKGGDFDQGFLLAIIQAF